MEKFKKFVNFSHPMWLTTFCWALAVCAGGGEMLTIDSSQAMWWFCLSWIVTMTVIYIVTREFTISLMQERLKMHEELIKDKNEVIDRFIFKTLCQSTTTKEKSN